MNQRIKELIERSKEDFDRDTMRYELLKRNKSFLKELEETKKKLGGEIFFKVRDIDPMKIMSDLSEKNILVVNDYPKIPPYKSEGLHINKLGPAFDIPKKLKILFDNYIPLWETFCERWQLSSGWGGNISSLRESLKGPVELQIIKDKEKGVSAIIIKIDNWTILNDIRDIWGEIEKYQNDIWKKEEKRTNFARDLRWYDLSKRHGKKLSEIAKIWIDKFPGEIDLLVIRRIKKEKEIDKKDLNGRALKDDELIHEVKFGFLAEKYRDYFIGRRDHYITGKSPTKKSTEGKFNVPFVDVIKKAISRMEKQISQMYYPYNNYSSAEELRKTLKLKELPLKL